MPHINEVFGITAKPPTYTYVDRAGLDSKFQALISAQQHLIIHGMSKQGKTVLRKKFLKEGECIAVSCVNEMTFEQVCDEILRKLNVSRPTETQRIFTSTRGNSTQFEASAPLYGVKLGGTLGHKSESKTTEKSTAEPIGIDVHRVGFIADEILRSNKRVVVEDFHYLPESEKRRLAFVLKALWDCGVFFIIVGIWPQQNLLSYYNGDLVGRVEEIDVEWTAQELELVLEKGQRALNIYLSNEIAKQMVEDANKNVGLLQSLAQKYCYDCGVIQTQLTLRRLADTDALTRCRKIICADLGTRYQTFCQVFRKGFKKTSNGSHIYEHVLRACVEAPSSDLLNGIHRDTIARKVSAFASGCEEKAVFRALRNLNSLQSRQKVSPLILSYNIRTKLVQLIDRELLFYRKYGDPQWPWSRNSLVNNTRVVPFRPTVAVIRKGEVNEPAKPKMPTARELRGVIQGMLKSYSPDIAAQAISRRFGLPLEIVKQMVATANPDK